jgi:hypothetical protein
MGRHDVSILEKSAWKIWMKLYPSFSGVEKAVEILCRNLMERIVGQLVPCTELIKVKEKPYQISEHIEGEPLSKILLHDPSKLNDLDPQHTSAQIVMAMLTNPEDGNPQNFILKPSNGIYKSARLICIDNDQSFVQSITKDATFWDKLL